MFLKKKKPLYQKIIFNQFVLAFAGLGIIVALSFPLAKNVSQQIEISQEMKNLQSEISSLKNKQSELDGLIDYLGSDRFIEEQSRLNMNYKKAGEEVVVIKGTDDSPENIINPKNNSALRTGPGMENSKNIEAGNPKKWLSYFFD